MLRIINVPYEILPREGVIYSRNEVDLLNKTKQIKRQAERNAQAIINHAYENAQDIRQAAFSEGYKDGMVFAIESIIHYIKDTEEYIRHVRDDLYRDMGEMLNESVGKTDTIIASTSDWIAGIDEGVQCLRLELPESYRHEENNFIQTLRNSWPAEIIITYHQEEYITLIGGNHIAEFNGPEFVDNVMEVIAEKYDTRINENLQSLSDAAFRTLSEKFSATSESSEE